MPAARPLPSQEYLRECFDYDPGSGELRWRERPIEHFRTRRDRAGWNARHAGHLYGSVRTSGGDRVGKIDAIGYQAHRIIFKWMIGIDPILIEHRDRDRLNNRWSNLRNATKGQNIVNSAVRRDNRLRLKGVRRNRSGYMARIFVNGHSTYLGTFRTPEAAHSAYVEAARARWGEFAASE